MLFKKRRPRSIPDEFLPPDLEKLALEQFRSVMAEFSVDVYKEAQLVEAQHNSTGGPKEITASMILNASNYVRGPYKTRRRDWKDAAVFGGGTISAIGLGVVSNQLDESWGPLTGIGLAAAVAFFGTISFMRGN